METFLKKYEDKITFVVYKGNKNLEYIKKYGNVLKSCLIINEKIKITNLNQDSIEKELNKYILDKGE